MHQLIITQFQIVIDDRDIKIKELSPESKLDKGDTGFVREKNISRDSGDSIMTESHVEY